MSCPVGHDVRHAAALLRAGRLVAFATETVYGLGGRALDTAAVARIFEAKERPTFDPLIVHVAGRAQLAPLIAAFPSAARTLADAFWPGPLTLVLPKTDAVPDLVTAGLPSVAVRIPNHPLALELLREAAIPVAAPSANPFGRISPTRAEHVAEQLGDRIDFILDGGPCRVGVESTIIGFTAEAPTLLRPGGVPLEEIEAVIGRVALPVQTSSGSAEYPQLAPGMLLKHYAPRTPLVVVDKIQEFPTGGPWQRVGLLAFGEPSDPSGFAAIEFLSRKGDLREAAANLFSALRHLDAQRLDLIVAPRLPDAGLGCAVNDRLRRAAVR